MDVKHITETYTHLGRMIRDFPDQNREVADRPVLDPDQPQPRAADHDKIGTSRRASVSRQGKPLSLARAGELATAVAEDIMALEPDEFARLHDLSRARIIPDRYV